MIEYTNVVGAAVWALKAWRELVVDQSTFNVLVQAGALGVIFFGVASAVVVARLWITEYWATKRAGQSTPEKGMGEFSYNHQMASTIHDVNRTLSEVAVTNKMIIAQTTKQSEVMEKQTVLLDRLVRLLDNGKYHLETSGD